MAEDTAHTDETETTTDHETIREWVEERGSIPAQVTEPAGDDPGSLAIIPEGKLDDSVREVSWDEFFEIFEDEELSFVYQTDRDDPDEQWFCQFTERGDVGTDAPSTTESEDRETLEELEGQGGGEAAAAGSGVAAGDEEPPQESTEEVGDLDEPAELDEGQPEEVDTDEPTSPMEEVHEERTDEPGAAGGEPIEGRTGETSPVGEDVPESDEMAGREDEAMGAGDVDEPADEGEVIAGETAESEPAEPLESEIETTDTTEREPLESDVGDDPMETPTDEQGVDAESGEPIESEPVGSGTEPAEPGEPAPDEEIPSEGEPTEADMGGESIESGSMEGEPIDPAESEQGIDETSAGAAGAGAAAVSLTDEDEGKDVVSEDGDRIGIVSEVRGATLYVDPDPGLTESITASLGWGDADEDAYPIEADQIDKITDDEVEVARL